MARKADPQIRTALLAAARHEFSQHGLTGARVSAITDRAGVSKGAFYLHFKNKERAFEEVAQDFLADLHHRMDEFEGVLQLYQDSPSERDDKFLEKEIALMEFLWEERSLARVLFEGAWSATQRHLINTFASHMQDKIESILRFYQHKKLLRPQLNLPLIATFIAGGFDRYVRQLFVQETRPPIAQDLAELHLFMNEGLTALLLPFHSHQFDSSCCVSPLPPYSLSSHIFKEEPHKESTFLPSVSRLRSS